MMSKRSFQEFTSDQPDNSEDSQSSNSLTTRKRRRLVNASQLDLCQELFDRIRAHRGQEGSLCETFMRLPTKRTAPEYYESVREPMDLARVQSKIKDGEYNTVDDMASDIMLIVANSKAFYPTSEKEFAQAVELQDVLSRERLLLQNLVSVSNASTTSSASSGGKSTGRKRGRKKKIKSEDIDDDDAESASIAASDDSRLAPSETSTTNLTVSSQQSTGAFENPYELLFTSIVKYVDDDGRSLAKTFTDLPSKEIYPIYYSVIKEPIDLRMIAQRIRSGEYSSMDELERDFLLMSRNAKTFNEPKSFVYQDASTLARILKGKRNEAEHPPTRTNKERGKRRSRLSYNPRDIVYEYATLDESLPAMSPQHVEASEASPFQLSTVGDDEDTRATGHTSQSCSSTNSTPVKRKRGRPPKSAQSTAVKVASSESPQASPLVSVTQAVVTQEITPVKVESHPQPLMTTFYGATISSPTPTSPSSIGPMNIQRQSAGVSRYRVGSVRWREAQVLQAILDERTESGHLMCSPFLRLPSRKIYPDYYEEIVNPISLGDIKKKLKSNGFPTLNNLMAELELVFANAQQYNVEESAIHRDSVVLQQVARKRYQEMVNYQATPSRRSDVMQYSNTHNTPMGTYPTVSTSGYVMPGMQTPLKRSGRRILTAEEAKAKRIKNIYNTVYNFQAEDGHYPRDVFMHLPSKDIYPHYYRVIPEPIDLTMIKQKMDNGEYQAHQQIVSDLRLMFNNARHFNEEGSSIYADADLLDRAVKKRLKSLSPYQGSTTQKNENQAGGSIRGTQSLVLSGGDRSCIPNNVVVPSNLTATTQIQSPHHSNASVPLLHRVIFELFQTVREYQSKGRQLSNPFMRLPTRTEMPAYYEFIKKPIELEAVAKQVVKMSYTDLNDFVSDLLLMFDNACKFNEPGSQIYADSLLLLRVCLEKRNMLLQTFASHLTIPPDVAPDITPGVRRLLTNLHNEMLTACDTHGRGLVDSIIAGDGTEAMPTSVTAARLAALHRAVAAGSYRRLDRMQADWLSILKRARIGEEPKSPVAVVPTLQQRLDAADLSRRFLSLRDQLCHRQPHLPTSPSSITTSDGPVLPSHLTLLSPALNYTKTLLERDLLEEQEQYKMTVFGDEAGEGLPHPLSEGETELQHCTVRDKLYRTGDFVYVEPLLPNVQQCHIGRIIRIIQSLKKPDGDGAAPTPCDSGSEMQTETNNSTKEPEKVINVQVAWYWRPVEAQPPRRRRLLAAEVFRTALIETVAPNVLIGHCLVMPITQFIHFRPKNFDERDIFICESQFSLKSKTFIKIQEWGVGDPFGAEFEARPVPFVPARLPPNEPLENALQQVDTGLYTEMSYPAPRHQQSILLNEGDESKDIIHYEQYVHQNGFLVKLGDFLYVPISAGSSDRHIYRVDKLWKSISQNSIFFSGPLFIQPKFVEHLPSQVFYPKELFLSSMADATHGLAAATGKCIVLRPADYIQARPTEFNDTDVYLCESKYDEDDKIIKKLKKGLPRIEVSKGVMEDEFYFFTHPIAPRKECSPLLAAVSTEPLDLEQLHRPASTAIACALASVGPGNLNSSGAVAPQTLHPSNTTLPSSAHTGSTSELTSAHLGADSNTPSSTGTVSGAAARTNIGQTMPSGVIVPKPADMDEELAMQVAMDGDRSNKKRKLRKPPSGYVIYAGEVRKKLLRERKDAPFGEISREVGLMWRQMPMSERDAYERRAQVIKQRMAAEEQDQKAREQEKVQLQLQQQLAAAVANANTALSDEQKQQTGHPIGLVHPPGAASAIHMGQPQVVSAGAVSQPTGHHTLVPGAAGPAPTMQFYQTLPTGQVIQIVHATSAASGPAAVAPSAVNQQHSQPSVPFSQTSYGSVPSGGHVPAGAPQVMYQLTNPPTTMMSPGSVAQSNLQSAYYHQQHHQQRMMLASVNTPTPVATVAAVVGPGGQVSNLISSTVSASPAVPAMQAAQIYLATSTTATGSTPAALLAPPSLTHAIGSQSAVASASTHPVQPVAVPHGTAPNAQSQDYNGIPHPPVQLIQQVGGQPQHVQQATPVQPMNTAHSAQFIQTTQHTAASASQSNHLRPPSPIFVSTPPRTSRVLHSEIYQRYINRLRKNVPGGLSDWRSQLSASIDTASPLPPATANQIASNFLTNPQNHSHHANLAEAVWSLWDHLLEDALKIRVRCLNSVECL